MKRTTIISVMLCLSLMAAGCTKTQKIPASGTSASAVTTETSQTEATQTEFSHPETSETEMTVPENMKPRKSTHEVAVEELSRTVLLDKSAEHVSYYPKLIVDGKEATEINSSLQSLIQQKYPMEKKDSGSVEGYHVRYEWGVRENTVSILVIATAIGEDYYVLYEAFNYDLDTLKELNDSDVANRFGMTDEEFFAKVSDCYRNVWDKQMPYDSDTNKEKAYLDKSLAAINYENVTPFVTPAGYPGVVSRIYTSYERSEQVVCINMANMYMVNL